MSKRLKRLGRLVAVQRQIHEIAQWRLASLERQEAERVATQHELVDALNSEEMLLSSFANDLSRKLGRLSGEVEGLKHRQKIQSRQVLDEALKLKRTERMASAVGTERRREDDKRALEEHIARLFDRGDASLG